MLQCYEFYTDLLPADKKKPSPEQGFKYGVHKITIEFSCRNVFYTCF
jgi:hypothetical protein